MGLIDRFRQRFRRPTTASLPLGPTEADVRAVRRALLHEAERLQRRSGLSLTLLMEHADLDFARLDIYRLLHYLQTGGEISNVVRDSIGNVKFDLTSRLNETGD